MIEIGSEVQDEIESGECLMRKIELFNISSYIAMSVCLALVLLKQISIDAQKGYIFHPNLTLDIFSICFFCYRKKNC